MNDVLRRLHVLAVTSWRERRTEHGGITDEVAMIAVLVLIAAGVSLALTGVLSDAIGNLDFDFDT